MKLETLRYVKRALKLAVSSRLSWQDALAHAIEGMTTDRELHWLRSRAREANGGAIVEIGSYRGRSTVALARGSQEGFRMPVYAIEPHQDFTGVLGGRFGPSDKAAFFSNILRGNAAETVFLVNLPSAAAAAGWREPISLLWIDGDHRYEAVSRDRELWSKFVIAGGLVAFHDSLDPELGPYRLLKEISSSNRFVISETSEKITSVLKREDNSGDGDQ